MVPGAGGAGPTTRAEIDERLATLHERRDQFGAQLLVDPHVDPAAWQQHGALLAAVDRLRVEIAAAEIDPACAMSEAAAGWRRTHRRRSIS